MAWSVEAWLGEARHGRLGKASLGGLRYVEVRRGAAGAVGYGVVCLGAARQAWQTNKRKG